VAIVIVGFRCAPDTAPKEKVNRVMRNQFVMPPTRGPMNAALSKGPNWAVGRAGIVDGERLIQIVM
jgi:hypothetical protein